MSKIVTPPGKTIKRIVIEIDDRGQVQLNASNPSVMVPAITSHLPQPSPLPVVEVIQVLMQIALSLIVPIAESTRKGKLDA